MIKILSQHGQISYGIYEYLLDTLEDLKEIPSYCGIGSTAIILETQEKYIKSNKKEWILFDTINSSEGGSSVSDWAQNDATKQDYIKNRTHYEYIDNGPYNITFDGTIGNRYNVHIQDDMYAVYVSELVPTFDELNAATLEFTFSGQTRTEAFAEKVVGVDVGNGVIVNVATLDAGQLFVVPYDNCDCSGMMPGVVLEHKGCYITFVASQMAGVQVIVHFPFLSRSVVKKIESKFLEFEQTDWENTDSTSAQYLKNKPFESDLAYNWILKTTPVVNLIGGVSIIVSEHLKKGQEYIFKCNGREFKFIAQIYGDQASVIGDNILDIFHDRPLSYGFLFGTEVKSNGIIGQFIVLNENLCMKTFGFTSQEQLSTATAEIWTIDEKIKKLNNKFLDLDWIPRHNMDFVSLIEEEHFFNYWDDVVYLNQQDDITIHSELITDGAKIKLKMSDGNTNSEIKEVETQLSFIGEKIGADGETVDLFVIGNGSLVYSEAENTGETFVISILKGDICKISGTYGLDETPFVSVKIETETYAPMPYEFFPNIASNTEIVALKQEVENLKNMLYRLCPAAPNVEINGNHLTWNKVDGAESYEIYRVSYTPKYGYQYTLVASNQTVSAFSLPDDAVNGDYVVRAVGGVDFWQHNIGNSVYSNSVVYKRDITPPRLTFEDEVLQITLFAPPISNSIGAIYGYELYKVIHGTYELIYRNSGTSATVPRIDFLFDVTSVKATSGDMFVAKVWGGGFESEYSDEAIYYPNSTAPSATTWATSDMAVGKFSLKNYESNITLSWNEVPFANGYELFAVIDDNYSTVLNSKNHYPDQKSSKHIITLSANKIPNGSKLVIRPYNTSNGETIYGEYSREILCKGQLDTPTLTFNDNILSWSAVDNALSYCVYLDNKITIDHYSITCLETQLSIDLGMEDIQAGQYDVCVVAFGGCTQDDFIKPSEHSNIVEYIRTETIVEQ